MIHSKRFSKQLLVIICLFTANEILVCSAQTADPVLYFSDITSGPKSGNSDASGGRTPGQDGAIITLWGVNLGATQGNSRVVCNGVDAASYYSWGHATQPANLYAYHRMQLISFQLSHLAQDGLGEIYVTVNGRRSNSLPFTVRSGNIFFVNTAGDDGSGDGSWTKPWSTINKAVTTIASGDIAYICDAVDQTVETDVGASVNLATDGEADKPKALIVYPNATSRVGNANVQRAFFVWNADKSGYSTHWVLSKFSVTTGELGLPAQTGFRVIGNYVTAPNGDGMDGAIDCVGNDVFVLGNECTNVGQAACDKLYHTIYVKGVRQDSGPRAPTELKRDIGWNYVHDNLSNRGINIYSEQDSSAFIEQHRVHDNVILNQRGDGIMLGYYVTGDNWIYNNLLIKAGLGPEWADPSYHCGIRINTGHEYINKTDVYCYNNTLYGCGFSGVAFPEETGHILISQEALQRSSIIHFSNNVICSTGEPYLAGESAVLPSGNHRNCWFGTGAAPSWDIGALNADPQFVNSGANDFQLQKTSSCINAGLNVSSVVERDLLGVLRTVNPFDLGVYEYMATTGVNEDHHESAPSSFMLEQNYPNPFNPSTSIGFSVPKTTKVELRILDVLGREVGLLVDAEKGPGIYKIQWNANVPTGVYFYRLQARYISGGQAGEFVETMKMIVLK